MSGPAVRAPAVARDRSPVTQAYLAACADPASGLRDVVQSAPLPDAYRACWADRTLSRPMLVPRDELTAAADDVLALFDLVATLPARRYDGDVGAYCADLAIDSSRVEVLRRFWAVPPTRYGRADLYHDGEAFRLLEFNVSSDLGGADRSQLLAALLQVPQLAAFAAEHGLEYVDTGAALATALRAAAVPVTGGREPVIGLVCAPGGARHYAHLLAALVEMLGERQVRIALCEADELTRRGGRLQLGGTTLDVVFRFFTVDDVCDDPRGGEWSEPVIRAHEDGLAVMWTPMSSSLYSNKGTLALLSGAADGALTPEESALVERLLPSTVLLHHGSTRDAADRCAAVLDDCRDRQQELVIKPLREAGGAGVVVGWEVDRRSWEQALQAGAEASCIVQRRVEPRREPVVDPATGQQRDWVATWGIFVTPEGYAGTDVRAAPAGSGAVVNYGSNRSTCTTGAFSHA